MRRGPGFAGLGLGLAAVAAAFACASSGSTGGVADAAREPFESSRANEWVTIRDFRYVTSAAAGSTLAYFGSTTGLERYDTLRDRWLAPVTMEDGLPDDRITALVADPTTGDAWVGTARGLARWVAFVEVVESVLGPPPFRVDRLLIDPADGSVWALVGGRWWSGSGGAPSLARAPGDPPFARLAGPAPVDELDPARLPWTDPLWVDTPLAFGARVRLTVVDRDRRGDWYAGTWGDNGRRWSLAAQTWEPMYFGLAGAPGGPIARSESGWWFLPREETSSRPAGDVSLAPDRVRVGLSGGGNAPMGIARASASLDRWSYAVPGETQDLPLAVARAAIAAGDTVWVATDAGVLRGVADAWARWGTAAPARALTFDGALLWEGGDDGLHATDRATGETVASFLPARRVVTVAVTAEAVYAGTPGGLYAGRRSASAVLPDAFDRVDARGSSIRALAASDTLLLVASEIGVEVFDRRSGTWRTIAAGEEREVEALALAVDPSGAAWIGTTAGLSRWRPDTGEWEDWTVADGLAGTPVLYVLAEDGVVWASTPEGVSRFDWRVAGR